MLSIQVRMSFTTALDLPYGPPKSRNKIGRLKTFKPSILGYINQHGNCVLDDRSFISGSGRISFFPSSSSGPIYCVMKAVFLRSSSNPRPGYLTSKS